MSGSPGAGPCLPALVVPVALLLGALAFPAAGCDTPAPSAGPRCADRAIFGDPADSPYVLPYPQGEAHLVTQSYCFYPGGHRNQLAYDFAMDIGEDVVASRAGVVRATRTDSPDDGRGDGEHNFILIQHEDGTAAFYAHLQQNGVLVHVGQPVGAGELIAHSGNSGLTDAPHLHFGVYQGYPPIEGQDVPINFRNAAGQLSPAGGLRRFEVYRALPP